MSGPLGLTLLGVRDGIASGRFSAREAVEASLGAIAGLGGSSSGGLNAVIDVLGEDALDRASASDARVASGDARPLEGVPIVVKDNLCVDRGRTTCGSRLLEGYRSPFTATSVSRLESAGAVVVAKGNLDEFAMGSSGEHSWFGATRNPWCVGRVPGGSSSGSASAVGAGLVPAALGSDTGGSIRQPASFCGVVGLKPTYGRVSRWGLVAFASSLDQVGPIARTVTDAALLYDAIAGFDALDSTSAAVSAEPTAVGLERGSDRAVRVGVPREALGGANEAGVSSAFDGACEALRAAGCEVEEVDLPRLSDGVAAYYVVAPAEASSNLARFDGVRYGRRSEARAGESVEELVRRTRSEGFGAEVRRRIMLGTFALSSGYAEAYYVTALKVRRLIKDDFDRVFSGGFDAVVMPTAPGPAFELGAMSGDPLSMYLQDVYTVPANLAGLPAVSVPMGCVDSGGSRLPVGVQFVGPAFGEAGLLRVARLFEREVSFGEAPAVRAGS